eukprot:CAMPEP_0194357174 /NCGR_PEP_ID=MMETSP0174-20130528/4696_1 /TAXON_ID=216777 /ORGANISM="Proboscia alata, Strain PI-D3" /LENGTH=516 /DNA_ID=CAMNT_0039127081 /DNA_START=47 /DNA_END=1597 /DNA_ORIENTATION=+
MSYRGGGGGGRGRGSGRGRGGRNNHHNNNNNHHNNNNNNHHGRGGGDSTSAPPRFNPCRTFSSTGSCQNGQNCKFAHLIKHHAAIDASTTKQPNNNSFNQNNNYNNNGYNNQNQSSPHAVSTVALWENAGQLKMFSGAHDGSWRLWNPGNNFVQEAEHFMIPPEDQQQQQQQSGYNQSSSPKKTGKVNVVKIENNFLFVGFEGRCVSVPGVSVGMVHAWNLSSAQDPPLEFHMDRTTTSAPLKPGEKSLTPYAHAMGVSSLLVTKDMVVVSGSKDGTIRIWKFTTTNPAVATPGAVAPASPASEFLLLNTLFGHAREITGLVLINMSMIWSSSTDYTIRLWDANTGQCQHLITSAEEKTPPPGGNMLAPADRAKKGHTHAVTSLLVWKSEGGEFILSSSLDGKVMAWSAQAECVASEPNGRGVVCMAIAHTDAGNQPLLLCGLEHGNIMVRNLRQTPSTPAFCLLMTISSRFIQVGHAENTSVLSLTSGPHGTFYSGGSDGILNVWQFCGDFNLDK